MISLILSKTPCPLRPAVAQPCSNALFPFPAGNCKRDGAKIPAPLRFRQCCAITRARNHAKKSDMFRSLIATAMPDDIVTPGTLRDLQGMEIGQRRA
ncbi:MAG: hypothetical protein U1E41_06355 [Paracoccus sp. (in: a-proteobacteria)]